MIECHGRGSPRVPVARVGLGGPERRLALRARRRRRAAAGAAGGPARRLGALLGCGVRGVLLARVVRRALRRTAQPRARRSRLRAPAVGRRVAAAERRFRGEGAQGGRAAHLRRAGARTALQAGGARALGARRGLAARGAARGGRGWAGGRARACLRPEAAAARCTLRIRRAAHRLRRRLRAPPAVARGGRAGQGGGGLHRRPGHRRGRGHARVRPRRSACGVRGQARARADVRALRLPRARPLGHTHAGHGRARAWRGVLRRGRGGLGAAHRRRALPAAGALPPAHHQRARRLVVSRLWARRLGAQVGHHRRRTRRRAGHCDLPAAARGGAKRAQGGDRAAAPLRAAEDDRRRAQALQGLPGAAVARGGERRARAARHGGTLPRLRAARPARALRQDRAQGRRPRRVLLRDCRRHLCAALLGAHAQRQERARHDRRAARAAPRRAR
mmetsp:Transcript_26198/g.66509  ORF Transcript_26198/g.66509 Transcript_26198/m.66509 type:complete len:447 (-) Transcript_26198:1056-2396(-)